MARADPTRRGFLARGGLLLGGLALGRCIPWGQALAACPSGARRLLFLFQRGGNDGVNTLIPHGDPDYSPALRPTLHIAPEDAIPLSPFASLHPALEDIQDAVLTTADCAAVHRVGYPDATRSHFDAQRIWENGTPETPSSGEGFLYRLAVQQDLTACGLLPVLSVQPSPPTLVSGTTPFVHVADPERFDLPGDPVARAKVEDAFRRVFQETPGGYPYRQQLADTGERLYDVLQSLRALDAAAWNPVDPATGFHLFPISADTNPPDPGGPGGLKFSPQAYDFFRNLKLCALALLNEPSARIAGTELSGFDTHDAQGRLSGTHPERLAWLGYGLRSLSIALQPIWSDLVVVTLTEFGRSSFENASFGTDHGLAACLFVMGGAVRGGVYNCDAATWAPGDVTAGPSGDLQYVTDYRAVFGELLRDHMNATPEILDAVFPGYSSLGLAELGLLA